MTKMNKGKKTRIQTTANLTVFLFLLPLLLVNVAAVRAGEKLTVAVAANFALPMEEIGHEFKKETGVSLQTTISSTGTLYAQIKNGAPYDLFFAADSLRPELLFQQGLASEPFVYARGQAVLWTDKQELCTTKKSYQEALMAKGLKKIGIANPKTAPYGTVATDALRKTGLWNIVSDRLVYAGNVGQAFQYATMGTVSMSFTAGSLAASSQGKKGCYWPIPEAEQVTQKACIITKSTRIPSAEKFLNFLHSPQVQEILEKYGYK